MTYIQYISKGFGIKFAGVVIVLFILFWLVGLWMPKVNSLIELKWLAVIVGIPMALFFVGNYFAWRKAFPK